MFRLSPVRLDPSVKMSPKETQVVYGWNRGLGTFLSVLVVCLGNQMVTPVPSSLREVLGSEWTVKYFLRNIGGKSCMSSPITSNPISNGSARERECMAVDQSPSFRFRPNRKGRVVVPLRQFRRQHQIQGEYV